MHRTVPFGLFSILIVFIVAHMSLVGTVTKEHAVLRQSGYQEQLFALPSPVLKIIALDYKGIASDVLFIKGIVYLGGFVSQKRTDRGRFQLTEPQWQAFYHAMDVSTDLDPYFQDPYYLANAFLTWDAGMVREANTLLDKGSRYRDWDWTLPFFSGFNYFYFLQENDKASEKLMEASRRNNNPILASLASKLAFKANKTENSIAFLEEMIRKAEDKYTKKLFEERVEAFTAIRVLEKAVTVYRQKYKRIPRNIDELVNKRVLVELPKDPYGGTFSVDAQGNIKTTSAGKLLPHVNKK